MATDRALDLAARHGLSVVALRNTTHWMRGGAFGWRAAEKGKILIAWTNTEAVMPAWGAKDTRLATTHWSWRCPGLGDPSFSTWRCPILLREIGNHSSEG
jgi:3-dehydro-L-gulonate 2-dehydrogenase